MNRMSNHYPPRNVTGNDVLTTPNLAVWVGPVDETTLYFLDEEQRLIDEDLAWEARYQALELAYEHGAIHGFG